MSHIASGSVERPLREVRDRLPTPNIAEGPIVGVYVDNISILGLSQSEVEETASRISEFFSEASIPLTWSSQQPLQIFETVGIIIDFRQRIIRNKPKRLWKAFFGGRELLMRNKVSVKVLERWLGFMTSIFMLSPHGLSCFFHIYKFVAQHRDTRAVLWPTVKREIRNALGVMWLARASIGFDVIRQVDVGDSSSSAYALLTTWCDPHEIAELVKWREVWRFRPIPSHIRECVDRGNRQDLIDLLDQLEFGNGLHTSEGESILRPGLPFGAGLTTQYADWLLQSQNPTSWLRTSAVKTQLHSKQHKRVQVDIPALVPPVPDAMCDRCRYSLLWRKKWRSTKGHINIKESKVAVSSLKRSARVRHLHGKLKVTLCDNLAGVCALERGRSSSFGLNLVCRQAASYLFISSIRWRLRHVETLRNPADEDSRFDKPPKRYPNKISNNIKSASFYECPSHPNTVTRKGPLVKRYVESSGFDGNRHKICDTPSCEPSSSSTCPPPSTSPPYGVFLEIFAGTARLTTAVSKLGGATAPPIDHNFGSHHDLRRRATQLAVLSWLKAGGIRAVHLGTPCTVFSRARHNLRNLERARERERVSLELAWFSAEVIKICKDYGIYWSLENPRGSRLFQLPILAEQLVDACVVDFDFCQYGESFKKPTRIITSLGTLSKLQRLCNHRKHSVNLRGSEVVIVDGKKVSQPKTSRAGAYPQQLADAWAQVILEDIDRSNRDHEVLRAQMNHELVVAAETKKHPGKQVQTVAELLHFEEIRKADPCPESLFVFGQDTTIEADNKMRRWEQNQKKVDWKRFKRLFHSS